MLSHPKWIFDILVSLKYLAALLVGTCRLNSLGGTLHPLFEKQTNLQIFCRRCADRTQPLIHHCCERSAGR